MTDKELLELAAKAAGIYPFCWCEPVYEYEGGKKLKEGGIWDYVTDSPLWNPLTDDGDALRLAVKLNLDIWQAAARSGFNSVEAVSNDHETTDFMVWESEQRGDDPYAATRRAIVRAAAQIGGTL